MDTLLAGWHQIPTWRRLVYMVGVPLTVVAVVVLVAM